MSTLPLVHMARVETPMESIAHPFSTLERAEAWLASTIDLREWQQFRDAMLRSGEPEPPKPGEAPDSAVLAAWFGDRSEDTHSVTLDGTTHVLTRVEYGMGIDTFAVTDQVILDHPDTEER